jgi:hypothetical protein
MKAALAVTLIVCMTGMPCLAATKADKVRKQISEAMEGLKDCPTLSVNLSRLEMLQTQLDNQGNITAALKSNGDMATAFAGTPPGGPKPEPLSPVCQKLVDDYGYEGKKIKRLINEP